MRDVRAVLWTLCTLFVHTNFQPSEEEGQRTTAHNRAEDQLPPQSGGLYRPSQAPNLLLNNSHWN